MRQNLYGIYIQKVIKTLICFIYLILYLGTSNASQCFLFNVYMQGTGSIGDTTALAASQEFVTFHHLYVRVPGVRANPIDFILDSGKNLNASGQVGDIKFMSNSLAAENAGIRSTMTDMTSVIVGEYGAGTYFQFQVNSDASLMLPPANIMVTPGVSSAPGGLGGICFLPALAGLCQNLNSSQILNSTFMIPRKGGGYFFSEDGTWQNFYGQIQISGTGPDNFNFIGYYQAELWGEFVHREECP